MGGAGAHWAGVYMIMRFTVYMRVIVCMRVIVYRRVIVCMIMRFTVYRRVIVCMRAAGPHSGEVHPGGLTLIGPHRDELHPGLHTRIPGEAYDRAGAMGMGMRGCNWDGLASGAHSNCRQGPTHHHCCRPLTTLNTTDSEVSSFQNAPVQALPCSSARAGL